MRRLRTIRLWMLMGLCGLPALSIATDDRPLPRWELGLGVAALYLPDYRGAEQQRGYLLPLPYIRYRGDRLSIDEEGVRGKVFAIDRLELDLSVGAGLPVNTARNAIRIDMPDLDPTVEIGPLLKMQLTRPETGAGSFWLKLPLRTVVSVDFWDATHQGWVFAPYLEYRINGDRGSRSTFSISAGPLYADDKYHRYYYEVAPPFATPDRPAYEAEGGYSGSRITLTWTQRRHRWWLGAFMRYDNLSGAVFEDSPLVRDRDYLAIGFAVARILERK